MQIKANFVNCKTFESKGKTLHLCTCISAEYGNFSFFVPTLLKIDYLKPITIEFELFTYNQRLGLKFAGVK